MSKADLKAAMESLQVKKPLRLPASALSFKTPPLSQDVSASEDTKTSLVQSVSQDEFGSQVANQKPNDSVEAISVSKVPTTSKDANTSGDVILPKDKKASQDTAKSQVHFESKDIDSFQDVDTAKVEAASLIPRASQPRRATEQDRAVTEAVSLKSRLSTGYTRVPNSVLMEMVSGDLSRNEMKIILLIARMTISFNRSHVPLSKGVIQRMSGVQGRSVLDALQTLQEAGLIEKLPGDCNSPNRLGLIYDPLPAPNTTQVPKTSGDAVGTTDAKGTKGWDKNSTYKKDNSETIDLRKKISLSSLSENLRKYFSELKPRRKREIEFEAFEELKIDFDEEQISACLSYLQARGLPISGAPCHSPMSYLAKAMAEILRHVEAEQNRARRQQGRIEKENEAQRARTEQEAREAAEWCVRERAFHKAFPSEESRHKALAELCRGSFFRPGTDPGRIFAIDRWWEGLTKYEHEELGG